MFSMSRRERLGICITCISNEDAYDEFLFRIKKRLIESEGADLVSHEIIWFVENIQ